MVMSCASFGPRRSTYSYSYESEVSAVGTTLMWFETKIEVITSSTMSGYATCNPTVAGFYLSLQMQVEFDILGLAPE